MRMRQAVLIGIVLAAVVGAAFAVREDPAALNAADDVVTSRYRMAVVRVDLTADSAGEPLGLTEFGDGGAARKPLAPAAAAAGQFASVAYPHRVLDALATRGTAEVVWRGEFETGHGKKGSVTSGTRFPVLGVEIRGNQEFVTTKFEKTGFRCDVVRVRDDMHAVRMEGSVVAAWTPGLSPVISEFTIEGEIVLPDAHTAVFMVLERTDGEMLASDLVARAEGKKPESFSDAVRQFYVLLTRLDF